MVEYAVFDATQRVAERVIEAAAAALLWCGEDGFGVLDHVAGNAAWNMASSRLVFAEVFAQCPIEAGEACAVEPDFPPRPVDPNLSPAMPPAVSDSKSSEAFPAVAWAALPAWAVPKWAARVDAAVRAAQRAVREAEYTVAELAERCGPNAGGLICDGAAARLRSEIRKLAALEAIALWGRDLLSLDAVERLALAVTGEDAAAV